MLTYEVTTQCRVGEKTSTRTVDCHYFQADSTFVYFKNGANKTVLAVPVDDVIAIDLKQEHDGIGQSEGRDADSATAAR